jgi:hypothetical protein
MASYQIVHTSEEQQEEDDQAPTMPIKPKSRSFIGSVMLTICIISFVIQTELSQYVQRTTNYSKPYFIL